MKKYFIVALVCCFSAGVVLAAQLDGGQTLSVTGTGIVQVEPDTATVKLGVEVSQKTAQEAQANNAAIMAKVAGAIAKVGIAKEKVQTAGFNIWPEIKYEQNQPPKIVGYRCSNQVNITVDDLAKVSRVIDAGINAGANNVQGLQFLRQDDAAAKQQALRRAVDDAAAKAKAIAAAAGLKIAGVKNIIESGAIPPIINQEAGVMRAMSADSSTPVSAGLLEIRGNVSITYDLK
ncbi:MAG: SIMPL domain-containing protein [Candidatus Margulisbacteria bacterium]|nr:SIMPL domain-containing protein [Candidatus Margulisiibacteriota bacterium]